MSIYHCSAKVIKRSEGRSAVGAAAYRSGQAITDERTSMVHDYSKKKGVDFTAILAPDHAAQMTRSELWNLVEKIEKRKDAQVAREVEIAIPKELSLEQMWGVVMDFAKHQFVDRGMIADIAIHDAYGDNPHAHILLTTREVTLEGFGKKNRDWNQKDLLKIWREEWEKHVNHALKKAGHEARIDHRTLEAQGIEQIPQIHIGAKVKEMERRGVRTERAAKALGIEQTNAKIIDLQTRRDEIERKRRDELDQALKERIILAAAEKEREKRFVEIKNSPMPNRRSPVINDNPITAYRKEWKGLIHQNGDNVSVDGGDYMISRKLLILGMEPADLEQAIKEGSPEQPISEAHGKTDYAHRTVALAQNSQEVLQHQKEEREKKAFESIPEGVKLRWNAEDARHKAVISSKISRMEVKLRGEHDRQTKKLQNHCLSRPKKPVLPWLRIRYKRDLRDWDDRFRGLSARNDQLFQRLKTVTKASDTIYSRSAARIAKEKPELDAAYRRIMIEEQIVAERERGERIAREHREERERKAQREALEQSEREKRAQKARERTSGRDDDFDIGF